MSEFMYKFILPEKLGEHNGAYYYCEINGDRKYKNNLQRPLSLLYSLNILSIVNNPYILAECIFYG